MNKITSVRTSSGLLLAVSARSVSRRLAVLLSAATLASSCTGENTGLQGNLQLNSTDSQPPISDGVVGGTDGTRSDGSGGGAGHGGQGGMGGFGGSAGHGGNPDMGTGGMGGTPIPDAGTSGADGAAGHGGAGGSRTDATADAAPADAAVDARVDSGRPDAAPDSARPDARPDAGGRCVENDDCNDMNRMVCLDGACVEATCQELADGAEVTIAGVSQRFYNFCDQETLMLVNCTENLAGQTVNLPQPENCVCLCESNNCEVANHAPPTARCAPLECQEDINCASETDVCFQGVCVEASLTCEETADGAILRQGRWLEQFYHTCTEAGRRLLARCAGENPDFVEDVEVECPENSVCTDVPDDELASMCEPLEGADAGVDGGRRDGGPTDATTDGDTDARSDAAPDARPDARTDAARDAAADATLDAERLDAARDAALDASDAAVDAEVDAERLDAAVPPNNCRIFDVEGVELVGEGIPEIEAREFQEYLESTPNRFRTDHSNNAPDPELVTVIAGDSPSNTQFRDWFRNYFDQHVRTGMDAAIPYLILFNGAPVPQMQGVHSTDQFSVAPLAVYSFIGDNARAYAIATSDIEEGLRTGRIFIDSSWAGIAAYLGGRRGYNISSLYDTNPETNLLNWQQAVAVRTLFNTEVQLISDTGFSGLPAILQFNRVTGNCVVVHFPEGNVPTANTLANLRSLIVE